MRWLTTRQALAGAGLLMYFVLLFLWVMRVQEERAYEPNWHYQQDVNGVMIKDSSGNLVKEVEAPR